MNFLKIVVGALLFVSGPFYGHWVNVSLGLVKEDAALVGGELGGVVVLAGMFSIVWGVADIINKKP